jgi:catechol 2,3-dioxygenase-like lactoylglutathione lyase family enzyme
LDGRLAFQPRAQLQEERLDVAMLRPPDGHGGIELDKFHTPQPIRSGPVDAPLNALGLRRVMFAVDDIDDVLARMRAHGAELIGQMQYGEEGGGRHVHVRLDRSGRGALGPGLRTT